MHRIPLNVITEFQNSEKLCLTLKPGSLPFFLIFGQKDSAFGQKETFRHFDFWRKSIDFPRIGSWQSVQVSSEDFPGKNRDVCWFSHRIPYKVSNRIYHPQVGLWHCCINTIRHNSHWRTNFIQNSHQNPTFSCIYIDIHT